MNEEKELPKFFDFKTAEKRLFKLWEEKGVFDAVVDKNKKPFCLVIPPPNVTGILHMGHVLDNVPQDVMTRWHRMRGFAAVWIPGTDHAGIATQNVVKRQLDKEGVNFRDLGRDKFIERVWEWKAKHGSIIIEQLKRLGCSCDWKRERFTMDEQLSRAVVTAFVDYYKKGLIYKGKRMINWCTVCSTALANDEVEHRDNDGHLWHFRYPIIKDDGSLSEDALVVATTRPETMLGDTAVAVHPDDERYKSLHGRKVWLPLQNRAIAVIVDNFVDPSFGTGVVKVTPAHDPNDYAAGLTHNLPIVVVIGEDGKMTPEAGVKYAGLDRYEARKAVVADLEALGFIEKIEKYKNSVGECYRCNSVVEPLVSSQWFVRMRPLADKAKAAVLDGRISIVPESEKHDYFHWMDTIQDWCISRQLYWGHRIPVYYCDSCGEQWAATKRPEKCEKCGSDSFKQDEDVLDTWFSAQLWPFSTLGWPDKTEELDYWYPNTWLMSGRDIMFFWDARMIMAGLELVGDVPFRALSLHGLVRDELGRKLSKSLGNSPDPLLLFDEYGADAIRASISLRYPMGRQDSKLSADFYKIGQGLITKLWNSSRFILMNLEKGERVSFDSREIGKSCVEDRWIISSLCSCISNHDAFLAKSDFVHAFESLYTFFWSDFCDWYVEAIKPRFRAGGEVRQEAQSVALHVLRTVLKLFHPYIPFVTEELWQLFRERGAEDRADIGSQEVVAISNWPLSDCFPADASADRAMAMCMTLVRGARDARATLQISPKLKLALKASLINPEDQVLLQDAHNVVVALGGFEALEYIPSNAAPTGFVPLQFDGGVAYLGIPEDINAADLRVNLASKISKLEKLLSGAESRLANDSFIKNAPPELLADTKGLATEYSEAIAKLKGFVSALS